MYSSRAGEKKGFGHHDATSSPQAPKPPRSHRILTAKIAKNTKNIAKASHD
jgi:hypothetical protein